MMFMTMRRLRHNDKMLLRYDDDTTSQLVGKEGYDGNPTEAGNDAADKAFAIAVAANFVTGIFEILGCLFAEPIRAVIPPPAYYSLLTGVGFVYLAFKPMIEIAAEPIVCLVPLLVVVVGFFGGVKYKIGKSFTVPIAVVAILASIIFGWAGGCAHKNGAVEMYNYGDSWSELWGARGVPLPTHRHGHVRGHERGDRAG